MTIMLIINWLVALILALCGFVASARETSSSSDAKNFRLGMFLHFFLIGLFCATAILSYGFYQKIVNLSVENANLRLKRLVVMGWIMPIIFVAVFIGASDVEGGLEQNKVYGNVGGEGRLSFITSVKLAVAGYISWVSLISIIACYYLVIVWKEISSIKQRNVGFSVDQETELYIADFKGVPVCCYLVLIMNCLGMIMIQWNTDALEILFTILALLLSLCLVRLAYISHGNYAKQRWTHDSAHPLEIRKRSEPMFIDSSFSNPSSHSHGLPVQILDSPPSPTAMYPDSPQEVTEEEMFDLIMALQDSGNDGSGGSSIEISRISIVDTHL